MEKIVLPDGYEDKNEEVTDTNLVDGLEVATNFTTTENGAVTHKSTLSKLLDFFGAGGAMRQRSDKDIETLFGNAWGDDELLALKTLFYFRDVRGGQGERRMFRVALRSLAEGRPEVVCSNLDNIAFYGRWDDLFCLRDTKCWNNVLELVKEQFKKDMEDSSRNKPVSLLGKWLPSVNASSKDTVKLAKHFAKQLGLRHREYRKALSQLRTAIDVVEKKMTKKRWADINYSSVPSNAGLKYRGAFSKHDGARYGEFLEAVAKGEKTINAGTLYPYDVVSKALVHRFNSTATDTKTLDALWNNLPDYLEGKPHKGLVVADVSGSMTSGCGSVAPIDVSISLALYIAERNTDPTFGGAFLTFTDKPSLERVRGENIVEKAYNLNSSEWGYNTNLQSAFDVILRTAQDNNLTQDSIPEMVYIVSDMEFDEACSGNGHTHWDADPATDPSAKEVTNFQLIRKKFADAGFEAPNLVFWNVNARSAQFPMTTNDDGVCIVSGCSPAILKAILSGNQIDPMQVLYDAVNVERYDRVVVY
jgi:hypothetical protein